MTIKQYAKRVGVCPRTIKRDISAGRIVASLLVDKKNGPVIDINTFDNPPSSYKRRSAGRPKSLKN